MRDGAPPPVAVLMDEAGTGDPYLEQAPAYEQPVNTTSLRLVGASLGVPPVEGSKVHTHLGVMPGDNIT